MIRLSNLGIVQATSAADWTVAISHPLWEQSKVVMLKPRPSLFSMGSLIVPSP